MNKTVTFGFALVLIVAFQSTNYVNAQTNLTKLFDEDPQYQLCQKYSTIGTICDTNIIDIVHETNNTLLASFYHPSYMGPVLDAIYAQGFKIEAVIPDVDTDELEDFHTWIYFIK